MWCCATISMRLACRVRAMRGWSWPETGRSGRHNALIVLHANNREAADAAADEEKVENEAVVYCTRCGSDRAFRGQRGLIAHQRENGRCRGMADSIAGLGFTRVPEGGFKCNRCDTHITQAGYISRHTAEVCERRRGRNERAESLVATTCPVCNKTFRSERGVAQHRRRTRGPCRVESES